MKKTNILKVLMTLVMAFVITGAFAQTNVTVLNFDGTAATAPTLHEIVGGVEGAAIGVAAGNVITVAAGLTDGSTYAVYNDGVGTERGTFIWVAADGDVTIRTHTIAHSQAAAYEQNAEAVYQTVGSTFRLYADPDPIYSPLYAGAGTLDANARWTWTYLAGIGTGDVASGAAVNQNYVEFSATNAGSYTVTVTESNTAVACTDNGQAVSVEIIAAPVATITTADPGTACGDQPAATVAMTFTEAVPAALAGYAFTITESIDNLSDLGGSPTVTNVSTNGTFVDYQTGGKLNIGNALTGAASPYGFNFNTSALNVQGNKITRYTYTLIKASDQAASASASGLISAISQKSEYIDVVVGGGDISTYPWGAKSTYVAIVVPQPQTGPIYYIPNDFAY